MLSAIQRGMTRVYDKSKSQTKDGLIFPDQIRSLLVGEDGTLKYLPSFLSETNIYVSKTPVQDQSTDWLLMVRFGEVEYGIDGSRKWGRLDSHNPTNVLESLYLSR